MFEGRKLVVATMHEKEKVIAPLLEEALGVKCITIPYLDTDLLGTFTGEVERKDDPITTLRKKCLMAINKSQCDLVIASEGSFGQHPSMFFLNADDELLMLVDKKNDLEIISRELSTNTNFHQAEIKSEDELKEFAQNALFPSHALILRNEKEGLDKIVKGISDWPTLIISFNEIIEKYGAAYIETDMRAMFNPTRMKVIEKAVHQLVEKINSTCPHCGIPGFDVATVESGLPCSLCNAPTNSTLSNIFQCKKCNYEKKVMYPHNKFYEDPMYCDNCNP